MKTEDMVSFEGSSIPFILQSFARAIGEPHDPDVEWRWNLKAPYYLGWPVDPDSRLGEYLASVFPLPGLLDFEEPEEFVDNSTRIPWQFKRILEATGHKFAYEPGMLRGYPIGQEL